MGDDSTTIAAAILTAAILQNPEHLAQDDRVREAVRIFRQVRKRLRRAIEADRLKDEAGLADDVG